MTLSKQTSTDYNIFDFNTCLVTNFSLSLREFGGNNPDTPYLNVNHLIITSLTSHFFRVILIITSAGCALCHLRTDWPQKKSRTCFRLVGSCFGQQIRKPTLPIHSLSPLPPFVAHSRSGTEGWPSARTETVCHHTEHCNPCHGVGV